MPSSFKAATTALLEPGISASSYLCDSFGTYMGISNNRGAPKSSILIGFSTINHPFSGTPIFGKHSHEKLSMLVWLRLSEASLLKIIEISLANTHVHRLG